MSDGKKIFIVDDESGVLRSLKRMLRKEPFSIHTFDNGEDAISGMDTCVPDLVLSDYKMPGMDGISLLKLAEAKYPSVVKILMSGFSDVNEALSESGIDIYKFIAKPWDDAQLKKIIRDALIYGESEALSDEAAAVDLDESVDRESLSSIWEDEALMPVDILNALPQPVLAVNNEGDVEFINSAAEEFFGRGDSIVHTAGSAFLPDPVLKSLNASLEHNIAAKTGLFQYNNSSVEGEWFPVTGRGAVLFLGRKNNCEE